jgi:eukaryotic-like serine/threonine-protein kinase
MPSDRFKQLQRVFDDALEQPPDARLDFVERACADDPEMAERILKMLQHEASASDTPTQQPMVLATEAFEAAEVKSMIGRTIGRFRIEGDIASGGMGRVFKARRDDGDVAQVVALKLIRGDLFGAALLKRFSTERRILSGLNHPGIAHLIDAGTDEHGTPFVAMEFVDGLPLLDYCAQHGLQIRERLSLFRQILAAVSFAHRNLVVHRDLKPANVLVTTDGQVKLLDFGIAKALHDDPQQTATAERFFTPAYAAPEQLLNQDISVACDVYALGALLYALLTGVPPFDLSATSAGEAERLILKVPPSPLRNAAMRRGEQALRAEGVANPTRWARQLDGDLEAIAQKALRKEPSARYASVERFDEDIERYLDQRPVSASGTGWLYRGRKFCERNTIALLLTAAAVGASTIGIAQTLKQNQQIRMERDRAQMALSVLRDSFQSADPNQLTAGDTRARTILAAATREVGALEKTQPALFRDLAYQMGEIQLNLGLTNAGLGLIQRANRVEPKPSSHGLLLEIRGLIMASRLQQARTAIETHRAALRNEPEFTAEEAHLLYLERRYPQAIAMLQQVLSDQPTTRSPMLRERLYGYLAEAYRQSDRFKPAVDVMNRQIAEQQTRYGSDHPLTLASRLRRVELLSDAGDNATAERELASIKPLLDRHYDQGSALQGEYHNIYGKFLAGLNRRAEALTHFRQALAINALALGADHENTLRLHLNIAMMIAYTEQDRSDAYPHFLAAITGIEKNMGAGYSLAGFSRLEAAKSYYWDKNEEAARAMLTAPNALQFFPTMPKPNRDQYLAALYYGFGPQDCTAGWETSVASMTGSRKIARALMCRYDPKGEQRPTD